MSTLLSIFGPGSIPSGSSKETRNDSTPSWAMKSSIIVMFTQTTDGVSEAGNTTIAVWRSKSAPSEKIKGMSAFNNAQVNHSKPKLCLQALPHAQCHPKLRGTKVTCKFTQAEIPGNKAVLCTHRC